MKKALFIVVAAVALLAAGGVAFVASKPSARPASAEKLEATPERLARGKYLVENVSGCLHCHSEMNPERWGLPVVAGTEGKGGGFCVDKEVGFPGRVCASNITPDEETGLGRWTDGEILRAIREGVSRDGRALFPIMPYMQYRQMSDEDAASVVVYLRTLKPIRNAVPKTELDPPLNVIVRFMPQPLEGPVPTPDLKDPAVRGKYLVEIGACNDCHTPTDEKGNPLPGKHLAGGKQMAIPGIPPVTTANLTPHDTGLGKWTKETFIARFKTHADPASEPSFPKGVNTPMGWESYAGITEEDLGAIFDHLRTLPPVENAVTPIATTTTP